MKPMMEVRYVPDWKLIDSYEDTDDTTAFDYDPGPFPTVYDIYKVILSLQEQSGSVNNIQIRFQGDDSSNYDTGVSGSADAGTGDTQGIVGVMEGGETIAGEIWIRGGNMAALPSNPYPVAKASIATDASLLSSNAWTVLNVSYETVDQIRIFTVPQATGRLKVYGFNL